MTTACHRRRRGEGKVDNARRLRTAVSGPHACRAAADDLNTALGGDLKLTTFGPRLPELSREVELGDFFGRRVFGEPLLMAAFRGDAPGEDGSIAREGRPSRDWPVCSLDCAVLLLFGLQANGCRPIKGAKDGPAMC